MVQAERITPEPPVLETERLIFMDQTPVDAEDLYNLFGDPDVRRYITNAPLPSVDATRESLATAYARERQREPRRRYYFTVVVKATGEFIGSCGFEVDTQNNNGELAYFSKKESWGKGYAAEAQYGLLEYGFKKLGLHNILGTCDPENITSIHLMENTGMEHVGKRREHRRRPDGTYRDSLLYEILADQWEKVKQDKAALLPNPATVQIN